jgi:hypothetical protein
MSTEPAADPDPDTTVSLPADRSFVVQFRAPPRPGQPGLPCAGRVEHLSSGAAARFGDWATLRRFVEQVLSCRARS